MCAELSSRLTARAPIPPGSRHILFESTVAFVVPQVLGGQEIEKRFLHVPPHQVLDDPPLTVGQVPEALIVEVVDRAVFANDGHAFAQAVQVRSGEFAYRQLESVPPRKSARKCLIRETDGFDLELLVLHAYGAATGDAHVLNRDALAILPTGQANLALLETGFIGEHLGRLGAG
jgi:hypothetical protein